MPLRHPNLPVVGAVTGAERNPRFPNRRCPAPRRLCEKRTSSTSPPFIPPPHHPQASRNSSNVDPFLLPSGSTKFFLGANPSPAPHTKHPAGRCTPPAHQYPPPSAQRSFPPHTPTHAPHILAAQPAFRGPHLRPRQSSLRVHDEVITIAIPPRLRNHVPSASPSTQTPAPPTPPPLGGGPILRPAFPRPFLPSPSFVPQTPDPPPPKYPPSTDPCSLHSFHPLTRPKVANHICHSQPAFYKPRFHSESG